MPHTLNGISKISNLFANAQGDAMFVNPTTTDHLITFIVGMRDLNPFANADSGAGQGTSVADKEADPLVSRESDGAFTQHSALRLVDLDNSDVATWNLDGYLPSLYFFQRASVSSGATVPVVVASTFLDALDSDADDWAAGRPIFDGGIDAITLDFTAATYASSTGVTGASNPVVTGALSISSGNLVLVFVVMKSANAIGDVYVEKSSDHTHQQVLPVLATGKCVGTEAHWVIAGADAAYADTNIVKVKNPLGYELSFIATISS